MPPFGFLRRAAAPAFFCLLFLSGCAGHAARTVRARQALDRHDAKKALELYNEALDVESGSELPPKVSGDNALLLLDRSTISQQLVRYEDSSRDLETADKQIEMLDFSRSSGHEIGRYLFSDDTGPYKARPYEKLLINTLNIVNYLARGNLQGAKVEARRLAVMQKYLTQVEDDPTAALLGPGSYLAGFAFERAGEYDSAIRYYDEALKAAPYASLTEAVRNVAQYSGYSTPRLRPLIEGGKPTGNPKEDGELLVVVSYGRVPALHAERVPIGLALTGASLYMDPTQQQAARRLSGQGVATWVNYPELDRTPRALGLPSVQVDGLPVPVDMVTPVEDLVRASFERAKGAVMASAITRMLARGAVGAAAGAGAGKAANSGPLGMLIAIGAQAAMSAADTPDTRSWATLPARIAIARTRVQPGVHTIRMAAQGVVREQVVDIPKGGFAVVNLTELSQ